MESNKQEKYNLMHDNPVASHASWFSRHTQSSRMSSTPLHQEVQAPDPNTLINEFGQTQQQVIDKKKSKIDKFREAAKNLQFTKEQAEKANAIDKKNVDAYNFTGDSIGKVNTAYNQNVKMFNKQQLEKKQAADKLLNNN